MHCQLQVPKRFSAGLLSVLLNEISMGCLEALLRSAEHHIFLLKFVLWFMLYGFEWPSSRYNILGPKNDKECGLTRPQNGRYKRQIRAAAHCIFSSGVLDVPVLFRLPSIDEYQVKNIMYSVRT
jgi:hypothetical protein